MQPISFHDLCPQAGTVVEWVVTAGTATAARLAPADPVPLSYNQELHLRSARMAVEAGLPGNPWIGTMFDVDGPVDLDALGRTFTGWLHRHEALRSGFRATSGGIERFTLPAGSIALERTPGLELPDGDQLRDHLAARFVAGTDPFAWPPIVLGVVDRATRSTVFVGLDHVAGDGFSLALAVWELQTAYAAELTGEPATLPATGSYHDACIAERAFGDALTTTDPAVEHWRRFVRDCGGTTPTFPVDLGVEAGRTWPQRMYNRRLLDADEAATFESACREGGGGMFAGLLAAMAIAVGELTGAEDFRTVTPLHTRHEPRWERSMGWFITCAPLEVSLRDADRFTDVLGRARTAVRTALGLSRYPAARVIQLLGDDFRITRRDLFSMVSYTDYRKLPGAERHAESRAMTIGEVSVADDSHVWVSRMHDGLHVSIRHPDTPVAREVLDDYTRVISRVLLEVIAHGDAPLATGVGELAH